MGPRNLVNALLLAVILCGWGLSQDKTDDVIRVETSLVNIPVIVSDRDNRYLPGLARSNFRVFQDGIEQKIEVFSNDDAPMNIVLALDTSRSTAQVLGKIKKAAKEFIKDLDANDRCLVMSFDNNVEFLSELTSDRKALNKAIDHARIGNEIGTTLQDAVYTAINNKFRTVKGRKAIILLTDGKDFGSLISKAELFDKVSESDTVIYPIFYETGGQMRRRITREPRWGNRDIFGGRGGRRVGIGRFPRDPFPGGQNQGNRKNFPGGGRRPTADANDKSAIAFLERLSELTGGHFYQENNAELKNAFNQIADEMKRQYLIGFYPAAESPAGSVHKVKVQVDTPGAVVRSKGAYRTQSR
ncbi:MAG: VWA domain-containing protein [Acidobacteriota bacterium]